MAIVSVAVIVPFGTHEVPIMSPAGSPLGLRHSGESLTDLAERTGRDLRERFDVADADRRVRRLVHEHPFVTVGAAITFGYLAGRMLSRR